MTNPLRIVIADDEADLREHFRRLLSPLGHKVVAEAATGQEWVDACSQEHPDLVIRDHFLSSHFTAGSTAVCSGQESTLSRFRAAV
jgi:CheY-like chemotaxis protein